jgi:energy-coupling factor transport system permease protein
MTYRRGASPLHAARAVVASGYCVVLAGVALSFEHPVLLAAVLLAVLVAGAGAGVGDVVARSLLWGLPFAALIAAVNALVVRDGLTVIARLGGLPPLGQVDVTREATVYGGILGLRATIVIACFALHSAAVDPDELLRAFRRLSFRSALTAVLATRMVPVLARDARRLRDAQRCRPGRPASRLAIMRAVTAGALDRAVDVAATLEVRGYGSGRRPPRAARPWSRHDLAFAAAAVALVALGGVVAVLGWEPFEAYPTTHAPVTGAVLGLAGAVVAGALLPFADRKGIGSARSPSADRRPIGSARDPSADRRGCGAGE